jgi:hypothetical protein
VRRRLGLAFVLVLLGGLLPPVALAQPPTPPLEARLFLLNPPPNSTFSPTTPITLILQVRNVSGAPVITTDGFSASEFWRKLYFALEGVGTFGSGELHQELKYGTCHYRGDAVLPGSGLQVVSVEVLAGDFTVQYTIDPRTHFDLSRPGRYTVTAKIPLLAFTADGVITDCNVEFSGASLVNIGAGANTGRQSFDLVSNTVDFIIQPSDTVPPTTVATATPPPNAAGWNTQSVTLGFTATDNSGGAGVHAITVTPFGAQAGSGTQVFGPGGGSLVITTEGVTTAFYNADDNAGNVEVTRSVVVRLDRTAPVVTPPAALTVAATSASGIPATAPAVAAFLAGGTAVDNLDPAPTRLAPTVGGSTTITSFPVGTTVVTFRFQDVAGNIGTATSSITVTPVATGQPKLVAEIVRSQIVNVLFRAFDIKFTNVGTGTARSVVISKFDFKTLAGIGIVLYDPIHSPKLPITVGDLAPGASSTVRVVLVAPITIQKFTMTETGTFKTPSGTTQSFSLTQTIVRRKDRDDWVEDK